ncbi:hypothetical protein [Nostoc sp.]|uniref:hypothetical protein n=1 Tax=Nostoc sp. TaxID=1180 RepID=UPI002FFA964D
MQLSIRCKFCSNQHLNGSIAFCRFPQPSTKIRIAIAYLSPDFQCFFIFGDRFLQ